MPRVTTPSTCEREECGATFYRWSGQVNARFCSRQCWLKEHNTPERNAAVARATAEQRADMLRDRGEGKTYRKRGGRHEHRGIAEKMLGRKLRPGEVVHHEDEDQRNNDPTNLIVFASQGDHIRHHMKKRHAEPV